MKHFKKILIILLLGTTTLFMSGCGVKNVEGSLEDIMTKVYGDIPSNQLPMMLSNIEITSENQEYYLGTNDITYKEALASESMVGSIAHSVVLIRLNDSSDAEKVVSKLKESVNPRKWVCVGVEEVKVENIGDLVIVIMNDTHKDTLSQNFNNLSK